ncbi:hypothetical protein CVT24_010592 [Panaeolus cyanescens]|uniref:Ketoreductase (KR) domain-containing protein n=1 Tax=Panaeolus cyanescens TaxID=181874 RepID=A0A409WAY9_9AGAR|nr:hypothetical protein CVT24_010592 [Panaeolus cyanescens]
MQPTPWQFFRSQWAKTPPVPREDLSGKTIVVIGANVGLGFEAAKHFASMNPGMLILACRDRKRGEGALQQIKQQTGCKNVHVWLVDLQDHGSIAAFAERFEKENVRLDVLVANAAVKPPSEKKAEAGPGGWEITHLPGQQLIDQFTVPSAFVTSGLHYGTQLDPNVLRSEHPVLRFGKAEYTDGKDLASNKRYSDTKLLNVFFARGLNDRLQNQPLLVSNVCPGYCVSSLRRHYTGFRLFVDWLMEKALARTTEEGSRQLVWASVAKQDEPDMFRGAYISCMQFMEPSNFVVSQAGAEMQDKIWDDMLVEMGKINPKVLEISSTYLAQ